MTKYSLPYPLPLKNPHSPYRNFNYIRPIYIKGINRDLRDYQIKIVLTKDNFPLEKCKPDGSDIRFRDNTGKKLPYWIESWNSDEATIWCKIPYIPANRIKDIWIIYGNPSADDESDGNSVFDFFDDGEGDKNGVLSASLTIGSSVGFSGTCPRAVVADNGDWLMIWRAREDGSLPSGHEGQVWFSKSTDNGETWSTPVKLSNDEYDAINAEFVKYPNGDIEIFYTRYDSGSDIFYDPSMVSRSTDNGETWSEFTSAVSPLDEHQVMWQEIIIENDVYLATSKCKFYKSSDNGSSWTFISNITEGVDGSWNEPGLVYLENGEFVCVLRDGNKECTLQRRSTNWGQTWTTDGYIKSDGSVNPDKSAGTNVVLHQCLMWNKDKNGNDLGYVYMKAALYPGSYPRDEYAYISTNNCSSWVSRSLLRSSVQYCEAAIVFENTSFAKHFSGGGPITNDDLDISKEYLLSENGWTVMGGTYKYDNSKKYTGIMSLYGNSEGDKAYQDFTNPSTDGSAILEFDMYDNGGEYGSIYFTDQTFTDYISFGYYSGHSTTYYFISYGAGYISLTDVPTRSVGWHHFKMEVKPDGSAEFTVDGVKSSTTAPAGELDTAERVHIRDYDNSETWWDRIRVRRYADPEPTIII